MHFQVLVCDHQGDWKNLDYLGDLPANFYQNYEKTSLLKRFNKIS